jgi:hypothetical protein
MAMNERDDRMTRELERRAGALARDIAPERDLWPGIAMRLSAADVTTRRRIVQWPWLPMTAALVAGYALATWLPRPGFVSESVSPVSPVASTLLDTIEPALARLPAKTRAVVEADLTGLERDWQRIDDALAEDPDNPLLQELQMNAADRAAALREQMDRLTGGAVAEGVEI